MKKYAMAVSALTIAFAGFAISGPHLRDPFILAGIALMLAWAGVEFFIGCSRSVEGIVPSHPLAKPSRMLWLLCVIYSWLDFRNSWTRASLPSWASIGLLLLCSGGLALRVWAVAHLGKSFTYDVKRPPDGALVRTGPYRFIRHPGYLGVIILATLPGLLAGSIAGFIGLLLTTLIHTLPRMQAEEQMLEKEFGETFREYQRSTDRLLPFIY